MSLPTVQAAIAAPLKRKWTLHPYSTISLTTCGDFNFSTLALGIEVQESAPVFLGTIDLQTNNGKGGYPHIEDPAVHRRVAQAMLTLPELLEKVAAVLDADALVVQDTKTIRRKHKAMAGLRRAYRKATRTPLQIPAALRDK